MSENSSKLFQSFIKDIIDVFPEYEKRLTKYYHSMIQSSYKMFPSNYCGIQMKYRINQKTVSGNTYKHFVQSRFKVNLNRLKLMT